MTELPDPLSSLCTEISRCRLCAARFAASASGHAPRPVAWVQSGARVLIAGQAPGARVHNSGKPFTDPSGDRLRAWMGVDEALFYNREKIAIVPMAFCFPGYDAEGGDLPPPTICAATWRAALLRLLPNVEVTVLVGGYAQAWHLGVRQSVSKTVASWRDHAPKVFPLPHPSWRNRAWLARNPHVEAEVIPAMRAPIQEVLTP